jgi:hypothetical protein
VEGNIYTCHLGVVSNCKPANYTTHIELDAKCLKPAQNARIANRGGTLTEAGYISGLE